jgi:hypothetical protein
MLSGARSVAAAAFTIAISAASAAFGASRVAAALEWTAPAECPPVAELRSRVEAVVGRALAESLNANARVTRSSEGRYAADVQVRVSGREGERHLEESDCRVLTDAAAAVLAMSLMPEAPAPSPESPPLLSPPPAESAPPPPAPPAPPRFALGSLATAGYGTLPSVAAGAGLEAAFYPLARLRIEASFVRWLAQSSSASGQDFGGRFQLTTGDLRGCVSLLGRSVTLGPCLGIDFEHIDAYGVGSSTPNGGSADCWSPLAGALLRWTPARWLGFIALVDVAVPITHPSFVIERSPATADNFYIYSPAGATVRSEIAAEVRF